MPAPDHRPAIDRLCAWFEALSPPSLAQVGDFYTADARFKDPFNEVWGLPAITRIFEHMFRNLHEPRFVVTQRIVDGAQCFLVWEFHFRFRRFDSTTEQVIHGGSHLQLAADGRVNDHCDYWDAAGELYEKLPVLGRLMRWLKRRANT
ncbi:nuclear transport factor 2 family protein [Hydrogenophaga sp.]|uniref:nuclear transport factor 2 family protein n=1 Tax=Hydrogenophaga sp. TaxID=1904254 RepID=UPI003D0D9AEC